MFDCRPTIEAPWNIEPNHWIEPNYFSLLCAVTASAFSGVYIVFSITLYNNFKHLCDLRMYAVAGRSQYMHWFDRRSNHYDIDPQLKNSTHKSTIICMLCYVNRANLKIYLSILTDISNSWNLLINLIIISITLLVSSSVEFDLNLKSHYNTHVLNNKT